MAEKLLSFKEIVAKREQEQDFYLVSNPGSLTKVSKKAMGLNTLSEIFCKKQCGRRVSYANQTGICGYCQQGRKPLTPKEAPVPVFESNEPQRQHDSVEPRIVQAQVDGVRKTQRIVGTEQDAEEVRQELKAEIKKKPARTGDATRQFYAVAHALGFDPDNILDVFMNEWLTKVKSAVHDKLETK